MNETAKYHQTDVSIKNELDIINRSKTNPKEFAPIYEKYFYQIFSYILKRVQDENNASEITSLVFAKALKKLDKYTFKGVPFGSWLYQIARNEMIDFFKKNQKSQCLSVSVNELQYLMDSSEDEEEIRKDREEKINQVLSALTVLKNEDLELIELRFFEDLSFKEIAEIMNTTETNARVKTHRAITKLKEILKK